MKTSNINTRIEEMVGHFAGGNNSKFAELVGTNEANIRNYINGTQPKFDFIASVVEKFEINYEWLLRGKGKMLIQDSTISLNQKNVRLISRYAYSDYARLYANESYLSKLPVVSFVLSASFLEKEHLLAFELADDRMNSPAKEGLFLGDIVLGHLLNPKTYKDKEHVLITGQPFVIVTKNDVYIRILTDFDKAKKTFTLHSTNALFEDTLLPSDTIIQIFSIRQVLRNLQ